ncbi:cobalamin-binding protein [Pseudomonas sp.]|uniref:cobalamin-binding protein n=1 Tax=Pseudomonas sp. TaxID=306 RepID=UPI0028AA43EC|nr:cobalamin-binding protein [Pseudomonas sp.]
MRCLLWLLIVCAWGVQAEQRLRVVSLAPSMTELMLELHAEDLLVGLLDGPERPPSLRDLPSVGRYGQLDVERLLSLQPDLLLLWPGAVPAAQRAQLKRLGIASFSSDPHTLDQLIEQIQALAIRLGRAEEGERQASALRQRLRALREEYHRIPPLQVFYQVWDAPLYTVGGRQIISDALTVCGARNVFADLPQPAPLISVESVLQRDPQVILLSEPGQRAAWQAWPQLSAVAAGRVLAVPDKGLERPSGQMIEATARLCAALNATAPASR